MPDRLTIRGVATTFDRASCHDRPFRFQAGCLETSRGVQLHWSHEVQCRPYATTLDSSLSLFVDDHVVAFEAKLPWSSEAAGLAAMIRNKAWDLCSISWRNVRTRESNGVTIVERAELTEISIVDVAAFPGTAIWLAEDETAGALPPHAIAARGRFVVARFASTRSKTMPSASRARSSNRPVSADFLAKCRRIADMPKTQAFLRAEHSQMPIRAMFSAGVR